jgi:hypothetical protein
MVESSQQIVNLQHEGKLPKYRTSFLDRINSPEKLLEYLDSLLISDIPNHLVDKRRELNESGTALLRLILRGIPKNYDYHPKLKSTLLDYLDRRWQNPESGYWGAWYRTPSGIVKTDDLSITFHIVSYRKGDVPKLNAIAETTLRIKDQPYPYGWRHSNGEMSNHHNYDVVRLLRMGWPYFTEEKKKTAQAEIRKMLDWCLTESVLADGSFKYNRSDDSLGDSYYFGISFLAEVGYFNLKDRFWIQETFSGAENVREKIRRSLMKIKNKDQMMNDGLEKLNGLD